MYIKQIKNIVLVSDYVQTQSEQLESAAKKQGVIFRQASASSTDTLQKAIIQRFSNKILLYTNVDEFKLNINAHIDDLIFPYWFGKHSRNSQSLIPALCELYNIKYIGGDAYTRIVCNDKILSKEIAVQAGFKTPNYIIIRSLNEINSSFDVISYPSVIKPIYEGASIGITQRNKVNNKDEAYEIAKHLFIEFEQPILIEDFIPGKEVNICLLGYGKNVKLMNSTEWYLKEDEEFFINNLNTTQEKKSGKYIHCVRNVSDKIPEYVFNSSKQIFSWLDKVEILRIDGKLFNNDFYLIELTSMPHLGMSEYTLSLMMNNYSYEDIIEKIIKYAVYGYSVE